MTAKILLLDIETAPNTAYVWGLYNQNIATNQVVETCRVLSWAAKWLGEDDMMYYSDERQGKLSMLLEIHSLLDMADAVIHYNGTKFDIPTLSKEFLTAKLPPPSHFMQVDLLKAVRKNFRFTSNKLDFVCQELGLGEKTKHAGMKLWIDCMNGEEKAWNKMQEYNINDVLILEKLYYRLRPWVGGINHGVFVDGAVCPNCGSEDIQKRGYRTTKTMRYQRFQCNDCGAWSQDKKSSGSSVLKEAA